MFQFSHYAKFSSMACSTFCTSSTEFNTAAVKSQYAKAEQSFFVCFISGNIRICQGCRGSLRLLDGSISHSPNDIVVARLEKRPCFDKSSGTWCYPQKETNSHYNLKLACVVKAGPLFVPSTLQSASPLFIWNCLLLNLVSLLTVNRILDEYYNSLKFRLLGSFL